MSRYLLDTNIISDLLRNPGGKAARRAIAAGQDAVCTSIIVAAELRHGCGKKGSARLLAAVEQLLETIPVLPLEAPADAVYGSLRAELEAAGRAIGSNDLLIGAHAHALGATMVTANTAEFSRIQSLAVENWLD